MKKLFAALVVLGLVLAAFAMPVLANPQQFRYLHHEAQGNHDQSWTQCLPDDAWNGHKNHGGDWQGDVCNPNPNPEPTTVPPTEPGSTEVVPAEPTEAPCVGDSCGGIAFSGVNFQPGRMPTESGTVYVTDGGGLGGKIFFSYHFQAGEQWSDWIEFPLQFGVSGNNLQAWWVPDNGGPAVQLIVLNGWISTVAPNMLEVDW